MKKNLTCLLIVVILFTSCVKPKETKIGNQIWTTSNLDVSTFRNGDKIAEIKSNDDWLKAGENGIPAWCYYENDEKSSYGKLYNWAAVSDPRGLAPEGWRIPNFEDWNNLINAAGGKYDAPGRLKSSDDWWHKGNGIDKYDFSGLPGGIRIYGYKGTLHNQGNWWTNTSDETDNTQAKYFTLYVDQEYAQIYSGNKSNGMSVRCIKE
jgi:uncharacterized protein (TIGR02145 family)